MVGRSKVKKALGYLRVSGKGQVDGDGFPRQKAAIQRYAKSKGIEVVGWYQDEGVSGTKELADRAGLASLIDRLESNGVRTVLVENADRLARDLVVGEVILSQFREMDVEVFAANGTELTVGDDDPTRKLIRQVLGAVAEYDKSITVLKLRAARDRKRRTEGRCEGRKPYGTNPNEKAGLERIKQLRRKPRGRDKRNYGSVAKMLNDENIPTRSGKPWTRQSVHQICKRHGW